MRPNWLLAAAVVLSVSGGAIADEPRAPCKASPKLVGACFQVHGRIAVYNGIPLRIWVVGTHRMLAVEDMTNRPGDDFDPLPPAVMTLLTSGQPGETVVFGDYQVCPLAKDRPGWMRPVCVESASHLVAATWDGTRAKP